DPASQVPISIEPEIVAQIEGALAALRRPHPPGGAPHFQGPRGPRGREFGGAAMLRLLDELASAADRGEQLGVSEVAAAIGVDQPRSSRLVGAGVERGYVTRETDARDARRSVIQITAEGRRHLEHIRERRRATVESALAGFSSDDAATLARLLTRFASSWPH